MFQGRSNKLVRLRSPKLSFRKWLSARLSSPGCFTLTHCYDFTPTIFSVALKTTEVFGSTTSDWKVRCTSSVCR